MCTYAVWYPSEYLSISQMADDKIQRLIADLRDLLRTVVQQSEQDILSRLRDMAQLINSRVELRVVDESDEEEMSSDEEEFDDGETLSSTDTWSEESSDVGSLVDFIDDDSDYYSSSEEIEH